MSAPTHATTNRALIFQGPYAMSLGEIEMPAVGPDDVLIRVRAVGICGSDIHGFSGKTGRRAPGMVMGHEIAGEVVEVGAAASSPFSSADTAGSVARAGPVSA
jgi:threonine dehydrogenase-like Zn-dependent dehydrogenase